MGVLAAENRVDLHHVALPFQRIEIMRHRHQVGFRRQAIIRVTIIAVGENAQLAGFHECFQFLLRICEIARAGLGVTGDRLRQCRGGLGVGRQGRDHVHPVQRVQVIEMHHVIVHVLGGDHQVADQLGIWRYLVAQGVFHRADRGNAMHQGADAANTLGESPCIARVASLQDQFDAPDHGAGTPGTGNLPVIAAFRLDAQMAFDAGDWINYDSCVHLFLSPQSWAPRWLRCAPVWLRVTNTRKKCINLPNGSHTSSSATLRMCRPSSVS